MNKQTINFSLPATLSNLAQDSTQENFTRGKLAVFYEGLTEDKRWFTPIFSKKLVKSLPYTPVISYYDEEKQDFVGHATEQQILGIVDPCTEPTFEVQEDGNTWCICDVVLYTERPDKVGDLAKKIIGHCQSLELDPNSVEYKINYDENRHFKNIEFTDGKFVGVSVLGNDQEPAFTGSAFFTKAVEDTNFEKKMELLKNYCTCSKQNDQEGTTKSHIGGTNMDLSKFIQLSWGEKSGLVSDSLSREYAHDGYTYIVDMYDDKVIFYIWYYVEDCQKMLQANYTIDEDQNISFSDVKEVHVTYEIVEHVQPQLVASNVATVTDNNSDNITTENTTTAAENGVNESNPVSDNTNNVEDQTFTTATENIAEDNTQANDPEPTMDFNSSNNENGEDNNVDDASMTVAQLSNGTEENTPVDGVDNSTNIETNTQDNTILSNSVDDFTNNAVNTTSENGSSQENEPSTSSLADSERLQFENLKREKKINLINDYRESLSDEDFNNFMSTIDNFEVDELHLELLKKYKNNIEDSNKSSKIIRAFAFAPTQENANQDPLESFIGRNLHK